MGELGEWRVCESEMGEVGEDIGLNAILFLKVLSCALVSVKFKVVGTEHNLIAGLS